MLKYLSNNSISTFLVIFLSVSISSCWSYHTKVEYSEDMNSGYSTSKPIYLSIKNTEKNTIYLLLAHDINTDDFFVKVRWVYYKNRSQFKGKNSILRFQVDNTELLSFKPIHDIRIVRYNIDPQSVEEEAIYKLSREEFSRLANAQNVTLEIDGKRENKVATFNKHHTFKAFKDFLKNS